MAQSAWKRLVQQRVPHFQVDRVHGVDLARGLAVGLMILSHGVVALVPFEEFSSYGQVPIHLVTKFASTTFILVFGVALGLAFLPRVAEPEWPRLRRKLLVNGVVVLFWYKFLTVIEMLYLAEPEQILATLVYYSFPSFSEILGFYAIALLWLPFFLPVWAKMPLWIRLVLVFLPFPVAEWLRAEWTFFGLPQLQALLVEHPEYYAWGQITRMPIIFAGLLAGESIGRRLAGRERSSSVSILPVVATLTILALVAGGLFLLLNSDALVHGLREIADNDGKHPPSFDFVLFSFAGAFGILAVSLAGGKKLATILYPFAVIGRRALRAFIFHIVFIFLGVRYLLGIYHNVSYEQALLHALTLIFLTAVWVWAVEWIKVRQ